MAIKPHKLRAILLIWLTIVPAGLWFTYQNYPPQVSGLELDMFVFLILISVVASMPMVINNNPIFLVQWVALAVFFNFGLFVEIIFSQFAIIVLLIRLRISKEQWYRLPLNSIVFFVVSFICGTVFYQLNGATNLDKIENSHLFLLGSIYVVMDFVLNQVIIAVIQYTLHGEKTSFFDKDVIWDAVTSLLTAPLGFVMYILYKELELSSVLFVGVPFASLSLILNLYYSSDKINEYLQNATEIGHQMAERLKVKDVIDLFIQRMNEMLPVDYAYILDVVDDHELQLIRRIENGELMPNDLSNVKKGEGICGIVWETKQSFRFSTKKEWQKIVKGYMPEQVESVLCVPIVRNSNVVGILLLASRQKRAYEKSQLMIVDILCSHFAIAVENARHHEMAKQNSERCALTKLYNYRYFENMLTEEFSRLHSYQRALLSLIILDLDHFKSINDTYGHQSGNEILYELAWRLEEIVGDRGTVARYGGEEFVVLLPDTERVEASLLAERIRQTIADRPFKLTQHLNDTSNELSVTVTASLGVATAPEDADDSLALIRHADRALYVGAKRAGRNRVAEYVK